MCVIDQNIPHTLIVSAFYDHSVNRRAMWVGASEKTRAWMMAKGYHPDNEAERARIEFLRLCHSRGRPELASEL